MHQELPSDGREGIPNSFQCQHLSSSCSAQPSHLQSILEPNQGLALGLLLTSVFSKGHTLPIFLGKGQERAVAGASQKPFTVVQQGRAPGTTLPSAGPSICCSKEFSSSLTEKKNIPSVQHHRPLVQKTRSSGEPLEKCSWL